MSGILWRGATVSSDHVEGQSRQPRADGDVIGESRLCRDEVKAGFAIRAGLVEAESVGRLKHEVEQSLLAPEAGDQRLPREDALDVLADWP